MSNYQEQRKQSLLFVIILGALTAIGALSIDMFLPGLPQIQSDFNTTTSNSQLTLSLFMIGLALGNLFVGAISDAMGRKTPLVVAMLLFTLASIGIIFVENIWVMVALRFVQGFCGGAGAVISRAISSDLYSGKQLTKFLALLMLVNGVAPVIAPALGGVILSFATWRMVFVILTIFGILMLLGSLLKVPESLVEERRDSPHIISIFKNFKLLLMTPRFVLPMLIQGVTFIMLFSYISASPFVTQNIYHMSAQQFSIMFALIGLSLIFSSQLTGKLIDYIDRQTLLRILTMIQLIGVAVVSVTLITHLPIWILFIGFIILVAPVTGVATLGFSIAMEERTGGNGSASSLLGLIQSLLGGLVSPLVGVMGEMSFVPYVIIIILAGILLIILQVINYFVFKPQST
ncbi:multidrug effflux MFS transporter [Staphylococcus shinii]|jgi:DHA1 family bicyclomycin/chloramphenicol resistance-like MFS transporter|uniref:multidrug effflux MFS transporter n=1 Tax=Staphylococcus shinii TaxID=2912228 RepID=UPI000E6A3B91|nr:multidrug effflux MFS transporter [Staphylococcus shinii]MDW8565728.1 multidrug effflux MFS transporter [Staphylococcus shinii]MDW8566233.1 multidrug effflux MFS transporter [Staphylococcus shinii]MDW8569156.1 multidrug effflux MFS transporter [Staphylococcus shinii]MDW8572261.1 multidrug effflux MFS transporter [Staphylococcus shinii]RIN08010.1 Bcr/CflA family efflux MFS transporter [Staphylococcus shinii]